MKLFLKRDFDIAMFSGEMIATLLIIFLVLLVYTLVKGKYFQIALIGTSFIAALFIGRSISNSISKSASVFGFPLTLLLECFFYNEFVSIPYLLGAQLIGSIAGFLFFLIFRSFLKDKMHEVEFKNTLNREQFLVKEIFGQVLLILSIMFVTHSTYKNGGTDTNISGPVNTIISLLAMMTIMIIFSSIDHVLISPWMYIAVKLISKEKFNKEDILRLVAAIVIQLSLASGIGAIGYEVAWWKDKIV